MPKGLRVKEALMQLPPDVQTAIEAYFEDGEIPSDPVLLGLLINDLEGVIRRRCPDCAAILACIREMLPDTAYGSRSLVARWHAIKRVFRKAA